MSELTYEQRRLRDWYYRVAVQALHGKIMSWMKSREKDIYAMVDSLLSACELDPDMCAELIEQDCDRLRFIHWKYNKKGKPISCEVVWNDDEEYKRLKHELWLKKNGGST